jgi:integrase
LRWRDVNLAARKLRVTEAKTDAGVRTVDVTPTLSELLTEFRARARYTEPDDYVFATAAGKRDNPSNVRMRFSPRPSSGPMSGSQIRSKAPPRTG